MILVVVVMDLKNHVDVNKMQGEEITGNDCIS
jgi:hypothetical protein